MSESFLLDTSSRSYVTTELYVKGVLFGDNASGPHEFAEQLTHLAEAERRLGRYNEAIHLFSEALLVWKRLGNQDRICWCLWGIGATLRLLGRFKECLLWFKQAYNVAQSANNIRCQIWSFAEKAEVYRILGYRESSLSWHFTALEAFRRCKDKKGITWAYSGIGQIYRMEGVLSGSTTYFQRAAQYASASGDLVG